MTLSSVLFPILLVWAAIHALNAFYKSKSTTVLPISIGERRHTRIYDEPSTSISVSKFHLKIQTTAWNAAHDYVAGVLRRRHFAQLRRWMIKFYDFGTVMGFVGMIGGLFVLLCMMGISTRDVFRLLYHTNESSGTSNISKRSVPEEITSLHDDSHSLVQPIIPGVTVPLSHLPLILGAVFICQIFHELGHALSGALVSIPILSAGFTFTFVIPSAYVSFSTAFMDSLESIEKARIIAGGPWHNLFLWFLLLTASQVAIMTEKVTGVGSTLLSIGWSDVTMQGRVVVGLDSDSPLNEVLAVGSIITALDDVSLAHEEDKWYEYLKDEETKLHHDIQMGWCFPQEKFEEAPQTCCTQSLDPLSSDSTLSCFLSLGTDEKRCIDPIPVLTHPQTSTRCETENDCASVPYGQSICVRPDSSAAILRISVQDPEIILWKGPRTEIWEQVAVSRFAPRFWFIPYSILGILQDFWQYLGMTTISLYFFNLLPLPFLDGERFLSVALDLVIKPSLRISDEELGLQSRRAGPWKRRIERVLKLGTLWSVGICVVLGVANRVLNENT